MKNLITYLRNMNVEDKVNTRLDMLTRDGSPGHMHIINYFTKYRDEINQYAIIKTDVKPSSIEELSISHLHSYLGMRGYIKGIGAMSAEERTAVSEKGYENGRGAMSAKERMAANEKGYENGLGAMSAEARMSASEQGYENGLGALLAKERTAAIAKGLESKSNVWEEKYAVFDQYDGMPGCNSALYTWQRDQLMGFVGRIKKENATNGESTVWSDRREKHEACIARKKNNTWEEKYAVLDQYEGMPGCKSALCTWQRDQLKGFVGRIEKEIVTNGESTVWSDGREKLEACIARKKSKLIKPIKPIKGL